MIYIFYEGINFLADTETSAAFKVNLAQTKFLRRLRRRHISWKTYKEKAWGFPQENPLRSNKFVFLCQLSLEYEYRLPSRLT